MATYVMQHDDDASRLTDIPEELPILPLHNTVVYPFFVLPLTLTVPRYVALIETALHRDRLIGLVATKDSTVEEQMPEQLFKTGTVARVQHAFRTPDNAFQAVVQGIERFRIRAWGETTPYLHARIALAPDTVDADIEMEALQHSLRDLAPEVMKLLPRIPQKMRDFLGQVEDPRYLAYLVAANVRLNISEGQQVLEADHVKDKLRILMAHLTREKEHLLIGHKIQTEAREEMGKAQHDYYLRQQLKAIQRELGEADETQGLMDEYRDKIEAAQLPEEASREAQRELQRLEGMTPQAAEYIVIKTYLDWLVELPWNVLSADQLDINQARAVLDADHYGLHDVKDRIIEYLAVRHLRAERCVGAAENQETSGCEAGAILCFAGPPGVGKTSLGQSIARALGRQFTHMSLGGMRDEAEIRGHRRTYIGAMPGRIIQAIKRAGTRNPVFMLDEVDKVGNDWRGDPSSALLEVLDPAQNNAFRDHYLDVDFDLSNVIFISTANQLETIPDPLRDRMEVLMLDGYTEHEKVCIARAYLVPRQRQANGLHPEEIRFTDEALYKMVYDYTREAGVRHLERQIGAVCRKTAVQITSHEVAHMEITPERVRDYLKQEIFVSEVSESHPIPGIVTGLAVTAVGGDILFIEATRMKGKGELILTGHLGDVMRESAQLAHSYVRSKAVELGIDPDLFERTDVHLHVPAGAIPKDGPSAGVAMVVAIASVLSDCPARPDIGMTGEITLRGRVLPVGGVKMKVLAAHRAGLNTVIVPKWNERDLDELPEDVRQSMTFISVEMIDEVLRASLQTGTGAKGI
jgi:ATP-dependent Lon protease